MNALYVMDELMASNEINMRLTSMTPAFLLVSSFQYVIKKLNYALFKLGKSKEVYASFRHLILDIELLLVMRDNPPLSPPPLPTGVQYHREENSHPVVSKIPSMSSLAKSVDVNNNFFHLKANPNQLIKMFLVQMILVR